MLKRVLMAKSVEGELKEESFKAESAEGREC